MRVRAVCITRKTEKKDEKKERKVKGGKGEKKGGGENPEKESPLSCDKVDRKCKGDPDSESMTDVKQKKEKKGRKTESDI